MTHKKISVTFSTKTIIRVVLITTLTFISFLVFRKIAPVLSLIFLSFFFALALNPAVTWIAKKLKTKSRARATGTAYLLVILFLAGFLMLVIPPLSRQVSSFRNTLPDNIEQYSNQEGAIVEFIEKHDLQEDVDQLVQGLRNNAGNIGGSVISAANSLGNFLISLITILVLTFMMLVEGPMWLKKFWEMQDSRKVPKRKRVLTRMYNVVTGYVNGQVLVALIAGTFALVALLIASTIFDASINAVVFAFIVTLTSLIPMFGATIGAVIVVAACAFASWPLALTMAIFFIVYQQVENVTIQPQVQARKNELTPLLVFVAALIGVGFGGLLGAFLAIPIAGCIRIWVVEYYGDRLSINQSLDSNVDGS